MKALRYIILLAFLVATPVWAQTAKSRAALYTDANTALADTGETEITPRDIRVLAKDIIASSHNTADDGVPGTGTLTTFSSGNLAPLFTVSVANATSTPAVTFNLSTAAQNSVFAGPATGGPGAPAYRALVATDIPSLTLAKISDAGTMAAETAANYSTTAQIAGAYQPLALILTNTTASFTLAQESKLAGIASGATANSSDATLLARANHTGTQSADSLTDGTTNKAYTATEKTKLAGIATGATANSSDATLLARANHTGTQPLSTISDVGTAAGLNVPASGNAAVGEVVKGSDTRLTDSRTPTDGSVTAAKIAAALKPSGTAATTDEALRALGTTSGTAAAGNDSRLSDARTPTAHAASHTNGTDDIQSATSGQKGLATAAQITKLDGIEAGAQVNVALASQAEAEAGTENTKTMTALRTAQAIAALGGSGSGKDIFDFGLFEIEAFWGGGSGAGSYPMRSGSIGSGTTLTNSSDTNFPGAEIRTGTSSGAGYSVQLLSGGTSTPVFDLDGDHVWKMQWLVRTYSSVADVRIFIGAVAVGGTITPADGIFCRFDSSLGDTEWQLAAYSGSTPTLAAAGLGAIAADTTYTLKMWSTGDGVIRATVNGGTERTISTGITSARMMPCLLFTNATGADKRIKYSRLSFRVESITP